MLSSERMAETIIHRGSPSDTFIIMGEQSDASSIVFYTHNFFHGKPADVVPPPLRPAWRRQHPPLGFLLHRLPPTSSSATPSSPRPGAPATASGSSPRTPTRLKAQRLLAGRLYLGPNRSRQRPLDRPPPPLSAVAFAFLAVIPQGSASASAFVFVFAFLAVIP